MEISPFYGGLGIGIFIGIVVGISLIGLIVFAKEKKQTSGTASERADG